MRTAFFTIVDDRVYHSSGTEKMVTSFKRWHPDVDLIVYRQDMIDKVFREKNINFYMAKPTFAKLLSPMYELVVNVDSDHVFLARCEEILKGDYDIGAPINKNDYENTSVQNVTEDMFLQGGMVASTRPEFWDIWEEANRNAMDFKCKENDIMNLVIYNDPVLKEMKLKVFDKEKDYYGCKSLNRESEFYMEDDKVMCRGEQVFMYHHAKGNVPQKLDFENMGFPKDVVDYMNAISTYGKTVRYGAF